VIDLLIDLIVQNFRDYTSQIVMFIPRSQHADLGPINKILILVVGISMSIALVPVMLSAQNMFCTLVLCLTQWPYTVRPWPACYTVLCTMQATLVG